MKRRGFLGLLGSLPFVPKVLKEEVPPAATFKLAESAAATPAFSFTNDTDTGIYRVGNDNIRFRN